MTSALHNPYPILLQEEKILFSLLKGDIVATMMQSYQGIDPEISIRNEDFKAWKVYPVNTNEYSES